MEKRFNLLFIKLFKSPDFVINRVLSFFYKREMKSCGKNVQLRPRSSLFFGLENLTIGDDVSIPRYSHIFCTEAPLSIGNKVIFGPAPTIVTGNHRIDKVGLFTIDSHEKIPENDKEVIIEDDIWLGANVTVLMGVVIGRGSVVAAGAVVNKSCPPYAIIGGVPAKVLKFRFTIDEILHHEEALYPPEKRYSRQELINFRAHKIPKKLKKIVKTC